MGNARSMICPPPVHSSVPLNKMIVGKTTEDGGIALCATVDGVAVAFMLAAQDLYFMAFFCR